MLNELYFNRAVAIAKQAKEQSLILYRGKQKHFPTNIFISRVHKIIRMVSLKKEDVTVIADLLLIAMAGYSPDQINLMLDGGEVEHKETKKFVSSIMVAEATPDYQNVELLPYETKIERLPEDKRFSEGSLFWLPASEYHTAPIKKSVLALLKNIMTKESVRAHIENDAFLKQLEEKLKSDGIGDVGLSHLCDIVADKAMKTKHRHCSVIQL